MSRKNVPDAMVVEAARDWTEANRNNLASGFVYDILIARSGECLKVCYAAMERSFSRGLIEYGVSLRTAWPTKKGLELIAEVAK